MFIKLISCECSCKFDGRKRNSKQKWNNDKCQCKCKISRMERRLCFKSVISIARLVNNCNSIIVIIRLVNN